MKKLFLGLTAIALVAGAVTFYTFTIDYSHIQGEIWEYLITLLD